MKNFIFLSLTFVVCSFARAEGFIAGTPVKTPAGYVAIQEIREGDFVLSCDFKGACAERPVLATSQEKVDRYVELSVNNQAIAASRGHRFYVPETDSWIAASELNPSTMLMNAEYEGQSIDSVRVVDEPTILYSISVEEDHNFYVSKADILVHNFLIQLLKSLVDGYREDLNQRLGNKPKKK